VSGRSLARSDRPWHRPARSGPAPALVPSGQDPVKGASPLVAARSTARLGPAHPVIGPVEPGYRPAAPAPTGFHACAIRAHSSMPRSPSGQVPVPAPVETGRPGREPGLTGLCAGRPGAKPGQPDSSKKI
jgi:hypothetical protein